MQQYIIRRLIMLFPVLWGVSLIVFFAIRLAPGDAVEAQMEQSLFASEADIQKLKAQLGLDQPAHIQYIRWIGGVVRGDLGYSFSSREPVIDRILKKAPVSLELAFLSIIVGVAIAIPIGVVSAVRQDTWMDYGGRLLSIGTLSIPNFVLATVFLVFPAVWWGWTPPLGYTDLWNDPWKNFLQILPAALAVGARLSGTTMRMTRSALLEVLREDYIRTARAKGLKERAIIYRHALKNSMIPVVTIIGGQIGFLLGGSVVVETIFGLPGVGQLTIAAIRARDYPQIQGNVLFMATVFVLVNLLVDLSYAWFDPRIRYS